MKTVILTCGPRGAGKTTYVNNFALQYPGTEIVSRDDILISLYGSTTTVRTFMEDQKTGDTAMDALREAIKRSDMTILDFWNRTGLGRKNTVKALRETGFDKVVCWYFTTPLEICTEWIQRKSDSEYISAWFYEFDYRSFHERAASVFTDGFDEVITINSSEVFQIKRTA
ncbi:MAG: AAA family ATPase [Patescibacteria group bacterium]